MNAIIEGFVDEVRARGIMTPRAVFRFFAATSEGDAIVLSARPGGEPLARFEFPRQRDGERLGLADWIAPAASGKQDYLVAPE